MKDYESKTCLRIDMPVLTDNNISLKEYNKTSKYKDLEIEIEIIIVPVIVGALGMINKGIDKHINKLSGSPSQYKIPAKLHFAGLLIFLENTLNVNEKKTPKNVRKKKTW